MMKLALTLEADSVNVQALNMGRIVVDIDGVNLAELINMVCDNGYSLRVVDESDRTSADCTPPFVALTGIRCSTAHITETDNAWLYSLSHQTSDFGESEWIHFTGNRARYLNQDLIVLVRCRKPVIFRVGICVGIGWCCLLLTILNHEVKSHV